MTVQELIGGKEFMDTFIYIANDVYKWTGDYKGIFEYFTNELTEDEIEELLIYCDKKDLLED